MKITSHTMVYNEEKYIWYSIMSIVNYVDKMFIWDTGSSDKTVDIIKEIKKIFPDKIFFKELGRLTPNQLTTARQKMLDQTDSDWFIILDGDEVWWEESIRKLTKTIKQRGENLDSVVVPYRNIVGDIFHYQRESAGKYKIDHKVGFLTIRAINRKINGLHLEGTYPLEGFFDEDDIYIQERSAKRRLFLDRYYLHFSNVRRSSKKSDKIKYEKGISFTYDFYYPEVFFRPRPDIVPNPWVKMDLGFTFKSLIYEPMKFLKRKFK